MVGDKVVERHKGYPMGGSFSEIGTCLDFNYCLEIMARSKKKRQNAGFQYENLSFDSIFGGLLHVDDCLVGSGIYCCDCIVLYLQRIFPADVGIECVNLNES